MSASARCDASSGIRAGSCWPSQSSVTSPSYPPESVVSKAVRNPAPYPRFTGWRIVRTPPIPRKSSGVRSVEPSSMTRMSADVLLHLGEHAHQARGFIIHGDRSKQAHGLRWRSQRTGPGRPRQAQAGQADKRRPHSKSATTKVNEPVIVCLALRLFALASFDDSICHSGQREKLGFGKLAG